MIAAGEPYAGRYREREVVIGGSEHLPPFYGSVNPMMSELVGWFQQCPNEFATLKAAIAHAWLTHVHPFQDGNGRVARLLANIALAQAGLPPAIVKARTHRSRYLDALASSDPGGDILPVSGLFLDTLKRYGGEMEKPRTFRKMFQSLLSYRGNNESDWFASELDRFLSDLQNHLFTFGILLTRADSMDATDYWSLRNNSDEKLLLATVKDRNDGTPIFLILERPSIEVRSRTLSSERMPSIGFAIRNEPNRLKAFRRAHALQAGGLHEVSLQTIHYNNVLVRYDSRFMTATWVTCVEFVANRLRLTVS